MISGNDRTQASILLDIGLNITR